VELIFPITIVGMQEDIRENVRGRGAIPIREAN
jgi:hypothetical protein